MSVRGTFSNRVSLTVNNEYDKGAVIRDFNSVWKRLPYCLSKDSLKQDFLDIYLTTFSESESTKIQKLWGSSLFSKSSKFQLHFKEAAESREKGFCFWDNCIWIGIVKWSLLRTGYFPSLANVFPSSPKIRHVNKRDFSEHNFLASDKWISSRCCDADLNSVWERLRSCLSNHPLKGDLLDIFIWRRFPSQYFRKYKIYEEQHFSQNVENVV